MKNMAKATGAKRHKPTTVMKSAPLTKGKPKPKKAPKSILKAPPLSKGAKAKINAKNLGKLGQLSLKEKVDQIADKYDDESDAARSLQESMTASEKTRGWNRHHKWLAKKGNEEAKEEFDQAGKKEKGLRTALFLMRQDAPKFCHVAETKSVEQSLAKREKWLSEKEALDKWGEETLNRHVQSGRVTARECTDSWGVWEYCDNKDYLRVSKGTQGKHWQQSQEYQPNQEEEVEWQKFFDKDLQQFLASQGKSSSLEKGTGKGKGGEGGRKGNKPKPQVLALEDLPPEEQMTAALKKLKKTKEMCANCLEDFGDALENVKGSPYMSKQGLKDKQQVHMELGEVLGKVRRTLNKGNKASVEDMKQIMLEVAAAVKNAKDETKDVLQILNKATSRSSKG